jgi:CheY-like chemotaxis protein
MDNKPRKQRLMLVDDDAEILPLYELAGEIEDTIIAIQHGGLSALRWLDKFNYDVDAVIMDLSMPDMDGLTLTKLIRNNEMIRSKSHPTMIFWCTGWEINDTLVNAKDKYQVKQIFTKPVQPVDLVHRVKEILRQNPSEE